AYPQRAATVEQQRHDALISESKLLIIASAAALATRARVDLDEAGCSSDPHGVRAVIGECEHGHAAERSAAIVAEQPAVRIPVAHAAIARADPQHAAAILIERRDTRAAQTLRIVLFAPVADELARGSIEQVEPIARRHPQAFRVVFQDGLDTIVAKRAGNGRIVAEGSDAARVGIQAIETAVERADPQRTGVILVEGTDTHVAEAS